LVSNDVITAERVQCIEKTGEHVVSVVTATTEQGTSARYRHGMEIKGHGQNGRMETVRV
jgi:hypothetical protein